MALVIFDVEDGAAGSQGPAGPAGAQGPEGLVWRSTYNASTAYVVDDAVAYLGESFVCVLANTGQATSNATYWALLAAKGTTGSAGPQGTQGDQGVQGPQGNAGSNGSNGSQGAQGVQGEKGMDWKGAYAGGTTYQADDVSTSGGKTYICLQTSTGNATSNSSFWSLVADKGDAGAAGPQGAAGPAGSDGDDGATGDTGAQGAAGAQGATGAAGAAGAQGPQGDAGAAGAQGATGAAGSNGSNGAQGPAGPGIAMTVDMTPIGVAQYMIVDSLAKTVTFSIDPAGSNGVQMAFP